MGGAAMTDALVRELNRLGYQPVFLPRTNISPPELYAYSRPNQRLVRYGPLKDYLKSMEARDLNTGKLADIRYTETSTKKTDDSLSFLENALKCIGLTGAPKLSLKFAGSKEFSFSFSNVTYRSLDPSVVKQLIPQFSVEGIPAEYVEDGQLHVAYEYAYASELLLSRGDKQDFSTKIGANVSDYIDVGSEVSVSVASSSTISFKNKEGAAAAFAYKAGRLLREGKHWVFDAEVLSSDAAYLEKSPGLYVPQRAVVLFAEAGPQG
jgi:hypothetical protein